jgi:hypothetical protein
MSRGPVSSRRVMIRHRWAPSPEAFPSRDGGSSLAGAPRMAGRSAAPRAVWLIRAGGRDEDSARSVLGMGRRATPENAGGHGRVAQVVRARP